MFRILHRAKVGYTTTRTTAFDILRGAGHVELLMPPDAVGLVGHLVERSDATRDPWPPGRLRARAAAHAWRTLGDASELPSPPADWTGDPVADAVLAALEGIS